MKNTKKVIGVIFFTAIVCLLIYLFLYLAAGLTFIFHGAAMRLFDIELNTWIKALQHYESGSKSFQLTIVSGVMAAGIIFIVPLAVMVTKEKKNENVHGNARFASESEIEKEGLFKEGGIILGKLKNRYLSFGGNEFVYLAAPTRSGKGVGLIIPNCIEWQNSLIVNDIKGENYQFTSVYRKVHLKQEVFYFNPWEENTHRFNPLGYVSKDPNKVVKDLNFIALCLYPEDPKNPFWSQQASALFTGLALLVLETDGIPKTIGEILRQGTGYGKALKDHLEAMLASKEYSSSCKSYLGRFLSNSEDVLKNILSSFFAPLQIWESPLIDNATSANDFDLAQLRKKKMTIYLHTNAGDVGQVAVILNLLFSVAVRENINVLPEQDTSIKHNCLMILDEFPAIGKMDIIQKSVGYIAGYGMRLFLVCQNYAQLENVYGKEGAKNLYSNTGLRIYYAPDDHAEAKKLSDALGNRTVVVTNESLHNKDKVLSGNVSRNDNTSLSAKKLFEADELMAMGQAQALIQRVGVRFFLYDRIKYFSDKRISEKFFKTPNTKVMVDGEYRVVPLGLPLPPSHLQEFLTMRKMRDIKKDASDASTNAKNSFLETLKLKKEPILDLSNNAGAKKFAEKLSQA
jgi:type IV secretion system protein VirD4